MNSLRILHLEDNTLDADLVRSTLEEDSIVCDIDRVSSRDGFTQALLKTDYDIILSDFSMPGFDGLSALGIARRLNPEVPFIFLSGTIGEERAVESLRNGAVDYILKDRLQRLTAAVLRAQRDSLERAERRVHELQIHQQAELLNQAQDAIYVRGLDQIITYWNRAAERVYGWTAQEVIGQRASDLLYKPGAPSRDGIWKAVMENGRWQGELAQVTRDAKEIFVSSHRSLLRDKEGNPLAVLNINTDITEKKNLEMQVLRSQRMDSIGALAGGIAHDLNNVLAPIIMATELLRDSVEAPDQLRMIDIAKNSAHRGAEMVKQILQFAKGFRSEGTSVDLKQLIEDMAKLASKTFPPLITIVTDTRGNVHPVAGDTTQVHQILLNLCVNARDAMPKGGQLVIRAKNADLYNRLVSGQRVSGAFVELSVSDSGTGIPQEILGRIFEPFFTTKSQDKGTGLGLSTVLTIIRNHRGHLEIDTAVGKGTTFRVFLPAAAKKTHEAPEPATENPMGCGECVLLVDDELALLEMTKGILEACNYKVITATNGIEALDCFEANPEKFAAVITDLLIPGIDGQELISRIASRSPWTATICLSGSINENSVNHDQTKAKAFLPKPCPSKHLLTTLREVIAASKSQSESVHA